MRYDMVEMNDGIFRSVTNDNNKAPLLLLFCVSLCTNCMLVA